MIAAPDTDWAAHYAAVKRRIATAKPVERIAPRPWPLFPTSEHVVVSFASGERSTEPEPRSPYSPADISAPLPVKRVIHYVALKHKVPIAQLLDNGRKAEVVRARQEIYWRLVAIGGYSLPQVGTWLGGRDHTTVLHGVRRYRELHGERDMPKCVNCAIVGPRSLANARGVEEMVSST